MVLLGEIRHCVRTLLAFTRPYLGTASSMSNTLAVSTYSGGEVSSWWIDTPPPAFGVLWGGAPGVRIVVWALGGGEPLHQGALRGRGGLDGRVRRRRRH